MITMKNPPAPPAAPDPCTIIGSRDEYPWGLQITLEDAQLAALGIATMPAAGTAVPLAARAIVTGQRSDPVEGGGLRRTLTLQITDLELTLTPPKTEADVAAKMYTAPVQSGTKEG